MTLYIPDGATTARIAFNTPNLTGTHYLAIQSQYGKDYWSWVMTPITANNRYSEFEINITEAERKAHISAIYNYEVQRLDGQTQVVVESGLLKYTTEEGGSDGTEPFISANENLDAPTYYRPQYD